MADAPRLDAVKGNRGGFVCVNKDADLSEQGMKPYLVTFEERFATEAIQVSRTQGYWCDCPPLR